MLSDTALKAAIRQAREQGKPVKISDEKGLYMLVNQAGSYWRLDYRFAGKRKTLALGVYPDVSLKDARTRRDDARKLIAAEVDPCENRKAVKAAKLERTANSFETVAREWFSRQSTGWAASHADKIIRRMERDLFPWLGGKPIAEITAPVLLGALRRIESRGAVETAHRALQNAGQVFRYAVATGRAERDPSSDLRGALTPWKPQHYPSITDPKEIGHLLRAIDGFTGMFHVRCALMLAPLVFLRPGELRTAEWAEFDMDAAVWTIPAAKMKIKTQDHVIPLPRQAVSILEELRPLTGHGRYLFPGMRDHDRPMSDAAINAALRRLGYDKETFTAHGFRAMARTVLDEVLEFPIHIIEHQLAHAVKDANGRSYNRTAHLPQRREMMQRWADYLDGLKAGAEIIPLRGNAV